MLQVGIFGQLLEAWKLDTLPFSPASSPQPQTQRFKYHTLLNLSEAQKASSPTSFTLPSGKRVVEYTSLRRREEIERGFHFGLIQLRDFDFPSLIEQKGQKDNRMTFQAKVKCGSGRINIFNFSKPLRSGSTYFFELEEKEIISLFLLSINAAYSGLEKTRVFQKKKPNPPGFFGGFYRGFKGFFGGFIFL